MKEMAPERQPRVAVRGRACPDLPQGYPDECDESPLPQLMGVWKTAIIR
jgi:hypothetical protein